jgi:hypothetical protein
MKISKKRLKQIILEEMQNIDQVEENSGRSEKHFGAESDWQKSGGGFLGSEHGDLAGLPEITMDDIKKAEAELRELLGGDFEKVKAEVMAGLPDYLKPSLQEADPVTTSMGILALAALYAGMHALVKGEDRSGPPKRPGHTGYEYLPGEEEAYEKAGKPRVSAAGKWHGGDQ